MLDIYIVSYVEGRSLNKSCLSILVGIKDRYCNSQEPKADPHIQKELFKGLDPLILKLSKSEIGNESRDIDLSTIKTADPIQSHQPKVLNPLIRPQTHQKVLKIPHPNMR